MSTKKIRDALDELHDWKLDYKPTASVQAEMAPAYAELDSIEQAAVKWRSHETPGNFTAVNDILLAIAREVKS